MTDVSNWIDRCCRRLNRGVVLRGVADWLAVWLCVFGTLVLVVKFAFPALWPGALWAAATLPLVLGLAARNALRQRFLASDGAALLDRRLGANGLVMTVAERGDGAWRGSLPRDEHVWLNALPKLRPVRFARMISLPLLFVGVALLLPRRAEPKPSHASPGPALPSFAELPADVQAAADAGLFEDPTEYNRRVEEAEQLKNGTTGAPPTAGQYQQQEAIRTRIQNLAAKQLRDAERGRKAARELAAAAKNPDKPLSKARREQLERDVAAAVQRAAERKQRAAAHAERNTPREKRREATNGNSGNSERPAASATAKKSPSAASPLEKTAEPDPAKPAEKKDEKTLAKDDEENLGTMTGEKIAKTPGTGRGSTKNGSTKNGSTGKGSEQPEQTAGKTGNRKPDGPSFGNAPRPKNPPGAGTAKAPPKTPAGQVPDLKQLLELAAKMPPEAQRELMRMAQSGRFRMPENPEARRLLMEQAGQMLAEDAERLAELQQQLSGLARNFGRFGGNPPERNRGRSGREQIRREWSGGATSGSAPREGSRTPPTDDGRQTLERKFANFREVVLPPGVFDKPRNEISKTTGRAPAVNPVKPSVAAPSKTDSAGSESRAFRRSIRPRYRQLVRQYFEKQEK